MPELNSPWILLVCSRGRDTETQHWLLYVELGLVFFSDSCSLDTLRSSYKLIFRAVTLAADVASWYLKCLQRSLWMSAVLKSLPSVLICLLVRDRQLWAAGWSTTVRKCFGEGRHTEGQELNTGSWYRSAAESSWVPLTPACVFTNASAADKTHLREALETGTKI